MSARPRVGMISLGCAKNLVDSEVMLGHLERAGCRFVASAEHADVLVINTCGFIGAAREESIRAILEAAELKKGGRLSKLIVAGCMVQRYAAELRAELPEVDAFVGLDQLGDIAARAGLEPAGAASAAPVEGRSRYLYDHAAPRKLATPPWTAFVKIAEGCDHTCSFCAIPSFRGAFRSRPIDDVVAEGRQLAAQGVAEINLVAQDSSHYGRDRGERDALPRLLRSLSEVDGLRWIRVHYLYPNTVTPGLIGAMAELPKVVKYVDLPLQHADPAVLRRMRRGGAADEHLALLERFRAAMPDVALRTTFIVGFPGETESEFEALLRFVSDARFDHVGVFAYSHEEGTAAFDLSDDIPDDVKNSRRDRLMALQQHIVLQRNATMVGREVEVVVEGPHPETDLLLTARMSTQAPEVDGQVFIQEGVARPGTFVRVELTEVAGYDLVGRIVGRV